MMFSKGEVTQFQYSSAMPVAGEDIVTPHGTSASEVVKTVNITDFKVTVSTANNVRIIGEGGNYQDLNFNIPANGTLDFHWELPYKLDSISSTGTIRGIVASASVTGAKYSISGYFG